MLLYRVTHDYGAMVTHSGDQRVAGGGHAHPGTSRLDCESLWSVKQVVNAGAGVVGAPEVVSAICELCLRQGMEWVVRPHLKVVIPVAANELDRRRLLLCVVQGGANALRV